MDAGLDPLLAQAVDKSEYDPGLLAAGLEKCGRPI